MRTEEWKIPRCDTCCLLWKKTCFILLHQPLNRGECQEYPSSLLGLTFVSSAVVHGQPAWLHGYSKSKVKKKGSVDIHIGKCFQDVTAAVNFWSNLTRELLVKSLVQELGMSDCCVCEADSNGTVTERVQKPVTVGPGR